MHREWRFFNNFHTQERNPPTAKDTKNRRTFVGRLLDHVKTVQPSRFMADTQHRIHQTRCRFSKNETQLCEDRKKQSNWRCENTVLLCTVLCADLVCCKGATGFDSRLWPWQPQERGEITAEGRGLRATLPYRNECHPKIINKLKLKYGKKKIEYVNVYHATFFKMQIARRLI